MNKLKFFIVESLRNQGTKISILLFIAILLPLGLRALAADRAYNPGETLNPTCVPGATNCTVKITNSLATGTVPFSDGSLLTGDPTRLFWDAINHRLGVGTSTTSALLNLDAGTSTPSSAPLKFNSGSLLATPEAGAVEFNGSHLYFTATSSGSRYQLDQQVSTDYISITYSSLQTAANSETLIPGQQYRISDRNIILTAVSNNQLAKDGVYEYSAGQKVWGGVQITGSSGSVSAITVDGVDILGTTKPYATVTVAYPGRGTHGVYINQSLSALTAAIAAAINAHQSVYKAYAVNNWLFIEATATGVAASGYAISGTASGGLAVGSSTLQGGASDLATPKMFVCEYDFANDRLLSLYDPVLKNLVSQTPAFQAANGNTILEFNWDDTRVYNNTFVDTAMSKNFMADTGQIYNNNFQNGVFGNNFLSAASTIKGNEAISGEIYQNHIDGSIIGNILVGGSFNHFSFTNSEINNNNLSGGASAEITSNNFSGGSWITYNTVTNSAIDNIYFGGFDTVGGNIISDSFFGDLILGSRMVFANNSFTNGTSFYASTFKDDCFFTGNTLDDVLLAGHTATAWDVNNSTFEHLSWKQDFSNNMYFEGEHLKGAAGRGFSLSVDQRAYSVVEWSANFVFDGNTGTGAQNDVIHLGQVRKWTSFDSLYINPTSLIGSGASIKIGFTSDDDCILASTTISSLVQENRGAAIPYKLPVADPESIIMTVTGGSITSGTLQLILKGTFNDSL